MLIKVVLISKAKPHISKVKSGLGATIQHYWPIFLQFSDHV